MALSRDSRLVALASGALIGFTLAACTLDIPPEAIFECETEEDCGGDGYLCIRPGEEKGRCCLPSADAPCTPDLGPTPDAGDLDAGASDAGDPDAGELDAGDTDAGEMDGGATDGGSTCDGGTGAATETVCNDGFDEDCDGFVDCLDGDCAMSVSCLPAESNCSNGMDDDLDMLADCLDPDCDTKLCAAAPSTLTCMGNACVCSGGVPEVCTDGTDQDCNGLIDCADPTCAGQSCGAGCQCMGTTATEQTCNDLVDNDKDMLIDCKDTANCPAGTACVFLMGMNMKVGVCQNNGTCK